MTLLDTPEKLIAYHEGCKLEAYQDTRGVWTIGFGYTGPDVHAGLEWTAEQADSAFDRCLDTAMQDALEVVGDPAWDSINIPRQDALVDMAYNLGRSRFAEFNTFLGFVRSGDWSAAADDLAHTAWASEVGRRFRDDQQIIRTGAFINV